MWLDHTTTQGYIPPLPFMIVSTVATAVLLIGWRAALAATTKEVGTQLCMQIIQCIMHTMCRQSIQYAYNQGYAAIKRSPAALPACTVWQLAFATVAWPGLLYLSFVHHTRFANCTAHNTDGMLCGMIPYTQEHSNSNLHLVKAVPRRSPS